MYPVSEGFLQAVQENTRRYEWYGRIITKAGVVYEFTQKDIVKGSGYLSRQCCGSSEIELGTVYAAELGISLFSEVDRYTLEEAKVEVFYKLRLEDGSYEDVPMGIFEVSEANRSVHFLELKAYDYMLRFEKSFRGTGVTGTAYEIVALCCEACKVEMAQTQEEYLAMANGSEALSLYMDNDVETYRDVLFYIAQVLGGFFLIDRAGKLELKKYGAEPVLEVGQKHRFSSSFSDFVTRYTAVSSTNVRTQTAEYYGLEEDDGLTMNLGNNPFLQFGLEETREKLCRNILKDVAVIRYVPFDSETIGNPALDVGDVLRFSGGHADETQMTCITSCQYRIGGKQTLKCVGKNPRLAQAKSKNDKNIAGLMNQIVEGKIGFFSFTNAKALHLGAEELEVVSIDFVAGEVTQAEFMGLVVMDVTAPAVEKESTAVGTVTMAGESVELQLPVTWEEDGRVVVRARYVLNGTDVEVFYPTETYGSGRHTFPLYYPVSNVLPNLLNNFSVLFSIDGGSVEIPKGCCIAMISGQGLAAEAAAPWDGTLAFADVVEKYSRYQWWQLREMTDAAAVVMDEPVSRGLGDGVSRIRMAAFPMVIEDGGGSE